MQRKPMLATDVPLGATTSEGGLLKPVIGTRIFVGTVIGFAAVATWLSAVLNIYIDEAYSLHTTERGILYAFQQSLTFEQQPPLYFVMLAVWRSIDHSLFYARLTSVACAIGTLFVVRDITRRQLRNVPDWLPPLLVATNPFALWAATELRVYSLIIFLSAALISLFFYAFSDETPSLNKNLVFTCTAVAAVYTQYFFIATLIGLGVIVLLFERRRLVAYLTTMTVTIVTLIPMIGVVRQQARDASVETLLHPRVLEASMLSTIASFVLPHTWINALDTHAINVLYTILFIAIVLIALVGIRRNRAVMSLTLLTGTIVVFFSAIILIAHDPIEMPRHITTVFLPALLLMVAAVSSSFGIPLRRNVIALYLAIFAVCALAEDVHTYIPLAKFGDWSRVSHYLEAHAKPSEPIAVFDAESALPIRYTYRGHSRIVPIPEEQSFSKFDPREYAIKSASQLRATFPKPSGPTNVVWLVVERPCRNLALGDSCALLEAFVASHFTTVNVTQFLDTAIYELRARR